MLVLSTAHMEPNDDAILTTLAADRPQNEPSSLPVMKRPEGYLLHTHFPEAVRASALSATLEDALALAHSKGHEWLLLDRAGPVHGELPTGRWTAASGE